MPDLQSMHARREFLKNELRVAISDKQFPHIIAKEIDILQARITKDAARLLYLQNRKLQLPDLIDTISEELAALNIQIKLQENETAILKLRRLAGQIAELENT